MALSIDYSRVADNDFCVIPEDERDRSGRWMNPVTQALGFASMFIGIGEITEANAPEFYARLRAYELISGSLLQGPEGDRPLTPEDVQRHVGLRMNVSRESDAVFRKRLWDVAKDRAAYMWRSSVPTPE